MSTLVAFLFTGVVWLSDGTPAPILTKAEPTMARCQRDRLIFVAMLEALTASEPPTLRETYHVEPCRPVTNDSEAKRT